MADVAALAYTPPVWGRWSRQDVRVEQNSARVTAEKGEFLVLAKVPRRRGKHRWQITVQNKTSGKPMSIGIAVDLQDTELNRGAQDTLFQDRVWHYSNVDGSIRNGARQIQATTKKSYSSGDVIDVFFDVESGEITFAHNGSMLEGTILRNVVHSSFLDKQRVARESGEEVEEGFGRFHLLVSLSAGDQVKMEDSPSELRYSYPDGRYPWWEEITANKPSFESGTFPMRYRLNRALPPGLILDENTGIVSGTPSGINTLSLNGWRDLCFQMYRGRIGEVGWKKARLVLLKELGQGLDEHALKVRAKELFEQYDTSGDGALDFDELKTMLTVSLKLELSDTEIMNMAADLDVDGNAEIGLIEFEEMLARMYTSKDKFGAWKLASNALLKKLGAGLDVELELPKKSREIFNEYDTDGSGFIDLGELEMALHSLGVECDPDMVIQMIDEAGIDQGTGDDLGIDFPSWLELTKAMYTGSDESIWDKAKTGIIKMIGANLSDDELFAATDRIFEDLDADGSGELDMDELSVAMKNAGVDILQDELSRMLEECDVNGRLWTVTAANHLGECSFILKIIVVEGASKLQYSSTDLFCCINKKFQPLKIAHLRGARPFKFSVAPPMPEGMWVDEDTGTVQGRPTVESAKTRYEITAANEVNSTSCQIELQVLVPPSNFAYTYSSVIYKVGKLDSPAWMKARTAFIKKFGKRVTDETVLDLANELFVKYDADGGGAIDALELRHALLDWEMEVTEDEVKTMILEAKENRDVQNESEEDAMQISVGEFEKIVKQMFHGYKEGTDMFKIDPLGDWVSNKNTVLSIDGSLPFVFMLDETIPQQLPNGLMLDRATGTIHGVSTTEYYAKDFVIKASNRVGSATYTVKIEVLTPPHNMLYRENCRNSKLPLNREFYPFRCKVEGTVNALCGKMKFTTGRDPMETKKAFNQFDEDGSGELDAEEFGKMLVVLGAASSEVEAAQHTESMLQKMGKDSKKGVVTFSEFWKQFDAGLPKGMVINPDNGEITGIPEVEVDTSMYVITCWNPVGETSTTLLIEVQEPPHNLQYKFIDCLYRLGHPCGFERLSPEEVDPMTLYECGTEFVQNSLSWEGSKVSFKIYPPLPEGLSFDGTNGLITGKPTVLTTSTQSGDLHATERRKFEVTASNLVGKTTVELWIEVSQIATMVRYFKHELSLAMGEEIRDNEVILCDATRPIRYQCQRDPVFAQKMFSKYDADQGGSLDRDEFRSVLRDLGEKCNDGEFRWILMQVDSDKSGVIEFDEFWDYWKPLPYGLECDEKTGTLYGRPLRRCEAGDFEVTVFNKVGSFSVMLKIHVLDESMSRERDADRRRQFWYVGYRSMRYPNGETYEGDWQGGKWHGFGTYSKPDGYKYVGGWRKGRRHGACEETFPDGYSYKGEYQEGVRQGKGHLKWPNGNEYKGEFSEGKRDGQGYQLWRMENGEEYSYDGAWVNDLQHGEGVVTERGERCVVQSKFGSIILQRPGERVWQEFEFPNGSFYSGESAATAEPGLFNLHGRGHKTFESGNTYDGEFYEGQRHGWGTFTWTTGDRYEGSWKKGKFNGHGVYRQHDRAYAVWHDDGVCASRAPVPRVPVTVANQTNTGLSSKGRMLSYHGEPGYGQERVGFEEQYNESSVMPGHRDGSDFFTSYSKQLRNGSVLPKITRGQEAMSRVKQRVEIVSEMMPLPGTGRKKGDFFVKSGAK